jgi:ribosomal protein S18 acetylase RimI-like enzyme
MRTITRPALRNDDSMSTTRLQIRQARPDDLPTIAELIRLARAWQESIGQPVAFGSDRLPEITKSIDDRTCYVAVEKTLILGSFSLEPTDPSVWENAAESARYLHRLVTHTDFQALGFGSEMLSAAERMTMSDGATILRLDVVEQNDVLRRWYERRGYVHVGRAMLPHWARASALYEKRLLSL